VSLPAFRVARPKTVEEAVRVLSEWGPEAMVIAGGTDVVPNLQMRLFSPKLLLDVKSISALRGITIAGAGALRIGALTTLTEILAAPVVRRRYAVLASAVATIAGPLQRNMGTLGGNLCLETRCLWYNQSYFWRKSLGGCLKFPMPNAHAAHPETLCHVAPGGKRCWAVWSGDSAPALLTLEAEIEIASSRGARRLPLGEFYHNDGMNRIALGRDELLTAVHIPARTASRRGIYQKLRIRDSIDYPLAGVAVTLDVDREGICREARVAVAAVNPAPVLVREAGEQLVGQKYSPQLVEEIARAAFRTGKPLTTSASTPVYSREMLRVFTRRALENAWRQSNGGENSH